jgi:crotonobetainyl-CoA:carnitine CoA-transferase CaiB-like acyl-CoA transferase
MLDTMRKLKVVDISSVLAGPSVGTFFAELGAKVIKFENPKTKGDVTRSWRTKNESVDSPVSAYWSSINYGKDIVMVDISSSEGHHKLMEILADADILISNFKQGDDVKFNITYESLSFLFPKLICASISGYTSNPERIAYDVVLQAETGFMNMNGAADGGPVKMPVALIDILAAHQLKEGILCALLEREKTGKGMLVNCSLEKAGLASLANQSANYLMTGAVAQRAGSLHPNIAPYGDMFKCADGKYIVLAIGSDKQFAELTSILGISEISTKDLFINNVSRLQNRDALDLELSQAFIQKTSDVWMKDFIQNNVPAGAIKDMEEVMESEVAQSMVLEENVEGQITKRLSSVAFTIKQES